MQTNAACLYEEESTTMLVMTQVNKGDRVEVKLPKSQRAAAISRSTSA